MINRCKTGNESVKNYNKQIETKKTYTDEDLVKSKRLFYIIFQY